MATGLQDKFAKLFIGYEKAHGEHELFDKPDESGKLKGRASTKGSGASPENYNVHLNGKGISLGLIPLLEDDTCWFGAIDIDIQGEVKLNEPIEELEKRIRTLELPLVVCRSKSGGAHLYIFGKEPLPAKLLVGKLGEFSAALGYGGAEIFPKQVMRANDGDRGNWINIAYYGALSKEGTNRYCIRNGKAIPKLDEFLKYAEMMRISASALKGVSLKLDESFNEAPPCLQHLATVGIDQGGRNTALTNIAVFYKKSQPDNWQDLTSRFNFDKVKPSLPHAEMNQIIKNNTRKDYFYTCKNPPLVQHCDKKECLKRKFGIGNGEFAGEMFPIDNLTKCVSKDSVRWYVEFQGARVEVKTEELLSQTHMQKIYVDKYSKLVIFGKGKDYLIKIKDLIETATVVDDPDDASRQGQFEKILDSFFTASRPARNKDELIKGNSYIEDGRVHFRSEDLFEYLTVRRFNHQPHEVWMWLKDLDAESKQMKVKGKVIRVWSIPEPDKYDNTPIDLPTNTEEDL